MSEDNSKSYGKILKATAILGSASAVTIVLGIIRTKVFAVFLGPAGVGLIGIYTSIMSMVSVVAGMGINRSGVRQIAEASGSGDGPQIACTIMSLRRTALVLGAGGAILLVVLSIPISKLTFGSTEHWLGVAALSAAVFFVAISDAQAALVQGMRRLGDLARIQVLGAVWGTLLGIPIIWKWRGDGIVPMLIVVAAMSILSSWWFARKVEIVPIKPEQNATSREVRRLLALGLSFMFSGLLTAGAAYLIRIIINRELGVDSVGHYTAAYTLSGIYAGFILSAMGSDFYPRLTASASDNAECNRLVNEQAEISLLMAVPGLLATMSLAPLVIELFYSGKFGPSVEVLRWQLLGVLGRVASWPMGFIILAKGKGTIFLVTELIANVVHVVLVWVFVSRYGVSGGGMAFFGLYCIHWLVLRLVVARLTGFKWSATNWRLACWISPAILAVSAASWLLSRQWSAIVGIAITLVFGGFACFGLVRRVGTQKVQQRLRSFSSRFGIAS